jgi:hypothetical protein
MKVIVDRFEGDYAVCEREDRTTVNVERKKLPKGVREGDVLTVEGDTVSVDRRETDRRNQEIKKLMDHLCE